MTFFKKKPKSDSASGYHGRNEFENSIHVEVKSLTDRLHSIIDIDTYDREVETELLKATLPVLDRVGKQYIETAGTNINEMNSRLFFAHAVLTYDFGDYWQRLYEMEEYTDIPTDISKKAVGKISEVMEALGNMAMLHLDTVPAAEFFFSSAIGLRKVIADNGKVAEDRVKFAETQKALADYLGANGQHYQAAKARKFAANAENGTISGLGFIEDKSEEEEKRYGRLIKIVPLPVWKSAEAVAEDKNPENGTGVYAIGSTMNVVEHDAPFGVFSIDPETGKMVERESTLADFLRDSTKKFAEDVTSSMHTALINIWAVPADHPADMPMKMVEKDKGWGKQAFVEMFEDVRMVDTWLVGTPICEIYARYDKGKVSVRLKVNNWERGKSIDKSLDQERHALYALADQPGHHYEEVIDRLTELNDIVDAAKNGTTDDWAWGIEKIMELLREAEKHAAAEDE
ncbi:MAG: hypothetical protein BK997_00305 [Candidatus Micrarchaeum sp. ARMAN-1]|nr:MAG: hypothetical protein BK997_00305 [Candidatus Micrarchaeum sp. ARMAN-1]